MNKNMFCHCVFIFLVVLSIINPYTDTTRKTTNKSTILENVLTHVQHNHVQTIGILDYNSIF